jgi:hypothetical protein
MTMKKGFNERRAVWLLGVALSIGAVLPALAARAFAAGTQQEAFPAPAKAVDALVAATRSGDTAELLKILGPESERLISSGDAVADNAGRNRFVSAYDISHQLESRSGNKSVLIVGNENWPFPIPLVQEGTVWRFDTKDGEKEILERRIGRNELKVIEVCRAYVEAQREYAAKDRSGGEHAEYAQHLLSTSGKRDGLYWPAHADEEQSPLGPLIAKARAAGYFARDNESEPFYGYYYKILMGQGANAPGGTKDYLVDGHMTGGFGMLAFPARYTDSGIMTFIVNQNGIVYQKDLGLETASIAGNTTRFDPDSTWKTP